MAGKAMKTLVAYFSPTGTTARVAHAIAEAAGADMQEIEPAVPYTSADLNWQDKKSRSTIEMHDPASRPALAKAAAVDGYELVLLGFPIWWYVAPTIINTYLESADFSGKHIVLFATSGVSGFGEAAQGLAPSCPGARITEGKVFHGVPSRAELEAWLSELSSSSSTID